MVSASGIPGTVVAISKEGGLWLETEDRTRFPVHVECVEEVRDLQWTVAPPLKIGDKVCFHGEIKTVVGCSDSEGSWKPLAEVAKCYKQVEPEQLLLSSEARRVIEYLKARDCPISIHHIFESMTNIMSGMAIMDGLIEAREAGIVRLDDGKYSIVRESC